MPIPPGEDLVQSHGVNATERITFMTTAEQRDWLKREVKRRSLSMSQIIRDAIDAYKEAT